MSERINLIIKDSEYQSRNKVRKSVEQQKQDAIQRAKEQEADCIYIADNDFSPANFEAQMGNMLHSEKFEKMLLKLNPNLVFEYNPFIPGMKYMYLRLPNGEKQKICPYHAGFMPEHSIIKCKEEMVWDYDATEKPLERTDLPQHEWVPGKGYVFNGIPPGWKIIKKPYGEAKRGWRTVLIRLLLLGHISITQLDQTFGQPSSKFGQRAWATHSGKRTDPALNIPF